MAERFDDLSLHAQLANASYYPSRAADMIAHLGYRVDHELSSCNHTVFHHQEKNHAVHAFRGSDPTNPGDLTADYDVLRGTEYATSRFKRALQATRKTNKKYGRENVSVTGHSLGGSQALQANRKLGNTAVAYAPGAGLGDLGRDIVAPLLAPVIKRKSSATIVASRGDPIWTLGFLNPAKRIMVEPTRRNAHAIGNFL